MITNFKIFENINFLPKVGDYIIINEDSFLDARKTFKDIISTIGQIIEIKGEHGGSNTYYVIKFDNDGINPEFGTTFTVDGLKKFYISDIKCWSDTKNELEAYLDSKKYNL